MDADCPELGAGLSQAETPAFRYGLSGVVAGARLLQLSRVREEDRWH
jgi:hypothetical protein